MKFLLFLFFPAWVHAQNPDISLHKDYPSYQKIFRPLLANLDSLGSEISRAPEEQKKDVLDRYTHAVINLNKEVENFVSAHTSSLVSLHVLADTMKFNEKIEDVERIFNTLNKLVKHSPKGEELARYFSLRLTGTIGREATEFTQPDINGNMVSLSSFRGKYVLVDFWASWCAPCRRENPNVVEAYYKYRNKNFTVLGISLDENKEQWLAAIEKDGLPWKHVSDLKYWNNEVAKLYNVKAVPTNFLVDPNGKIVAKNIMGAELNSTLCKLLECNE